MEAEEPLEAVAPVGEFHVEESAPRSRGLLYAVIAALILVAVLTFFFLSRKTGQDAPPAAEPETSASSPAAVPAGTAALPATSTTPAPAPAAAAAPVLSQEDIEKMVKEGTAQLEARIRKQKEAELKKMQKELERIQADARKRAEDTNAADAAEGEDPPPPQER
jgi:type IV secretory pathway VirB10-like protein